MSELLSDDKAKFALLMTEEQFGKWLRTHSHEEKIGVRRAPCECPISRFLRDHGMYYQWAGYHYCMDLNKSHAVGTPVWATMFMHAVDADMESHEVTAKEALEALRIIMENTCRLKS
jgi:hypothetical protein